MINWPDFGQILAVYLALALFGVGYNALIAWAERTGYIEGFVSFSVAFGVAITLVMTAVFDVRFAVLTAGAFFASGIPMVIGSMLRYARARRQAQKGITHE
jgi:hypothetical protein